MKSELTIVNEGRFPVLSYVELSTCWRRGLRNGNWHRLGLMEKIFYRAAVLYTKIESKITSNRIVAQLKCIAQKLGTTISKRILEAGMERARVIFTKFEEKAVFEWAPQLKTWLMDARYIFWLGLNSQPPYNSQIAQ